MNTDCTVLVNQEKKMIIY